MSRYHPLLRLGLFVAFYIGSFLLLGGVLVEWVLPQFPLSPQDFSLAATAVGGLLSVVAASGLMLTLYERRSFGFIGLSLAPAWGRQLALGFLLGLFLVGTAAAVAAASGQVRIQAGDFRPSRLAGVLVLLLLAAASEEMLFRGYGFQRLLDAAGPAISVAGLSLWFGVVHRHNPAATALSVVNTVLVGVLLALAYLRTGRLWLPIGLHWGWNFTEAALGFPISGIKIEGMPLVAIPVGQTLVTGGAYGPEASLLGTLVILAGTAVLLASRPSPRSSHA